MSKLEFRRQCILAVSYTSFCARVSFSDAISEFCMELFVIHGRRCSMFGLSWFRLSDLRQIRLHWIKPVNLAVFTSCHHIGLSHHVELQSPSLQRDGTLLVRPCSAAVQAERMAPAANTHAQSPDNSFVSYALEFSPSADPQGEWTQDGNINSDLLAASPDHLALQNALWDSWTLAVAYTLTGEEQYSAQGAAILETTFSGTQALLPNMQYARLIPRTSIEDSRVNPLGFQEMNEIGLGLDAASLLSLSPVASAAIDDWMWCAPASRTKPASLPYPLSGVYSC